MCGGRSANEVIIPRESGVSSTRGFSIQSALLWNTGLSAFADDDICMCGGPVLRPSTQPSKSELRSSRPRAERGEGAQAACSASASLPDQLQPFVFGEHGNAVFFGLGKLRAGAGTGDHV